MSIPATNSASLTIGGIQTDIQCTSYSDRHFVVVSQLGNFGTFVNAWCEESPDGNTLYQTKVLLGKREEPILHIYARQIIEKIVTSSTSRKPLVLAISLHKDSQGAGTMQEVLNKLFEINTWQ
jgi:hypothetical protein